MYESMTATIVMSIFSVDLHFDTQTLSYIIIIITIIVIILVYYFSYYYS